MLRVGFIVVFLFFQVVYAQVAAPQLRCLATATNGDITLTWIPPADPGSQFTEYEIWYATIQTGPYSKVGTIGIIAVNTFTHVGAGGDVQGRYYFMKTRYNSGTGVSASSDTLRSIFINLTTPPGIAGLNYNKTRNPLPSSTSPTFTILREFPDGVWNNIAFTTDTKYGDTIIPCSVKYNYLVTLTDNAGCTSVSNKVGKTDFENKIPPYITELDSVSVLPGGQTVIGYQPSPSIDADGYLIYRVIGTNVLVDSAKGRFTTLYTYTPTTANNTSLEFATAPYDKCANTGSINISHHTIYLEYLYDKCAYQTRLKWNEYKNLRNGIAEYRVYYSVNGGPLQHIATTAQTSFTHTGVSPASNVMYFVRVFNSDYSISSSSNRVQFFSYQTPAPDFIYIRSVSVLDKERIQIRVFVDSSKSAKGFDVYRSDDGVAFKKITFVNTGLNGTYSYVDSGLETTKKSYYYRVVAKDSCRNDRTVSNIAESILLNVSNDKNGLFLKQLRWNNYTGFAGGLAGYNIYRVINDVVPALPSAYTNGNLNEYLDNLEDLAPEGAKIDYLVTAIEGASNPYGIMETADSNPAACYVEAEIFIPTAFAPKGVNKVWLPVTHFVDKSDYSLKIFNRWGNQLFSTNNDREGWTGDGAPNDVYVYLIEYKNSRGEYKQLKGTFTLLQ